jgi:hypothetical protein
LSWIFTVRNAPLKFTGLRKSTAASALAEPRKSDCVPPVPTKPPAPQVRAVGVPTPPRATTRSVAWAAKPPPPVEVLAHVTVGEPFTAVAASVRSNVPLICSTPAVVVVPAEKVSGLLGERAPATLSPRMPSAMLVLPE